MLLRTTEMQTLRKMPGLYFNPPRFPALCEYLRGVHDALVVFRPEMDLTLELSGFSEWIEETFQTGRLPFGWMQFIAHRIDGDDERVREFVDLYLRYRGERSPLQGPELIQ